jgi:hypothetical protein
MSVRADVPRGSGAKDGWPEPTIQQQQPPARPPPSLHEGGQGIGPERTAAAATATAGQRHKDADERFTDRAGSMEGQTKKRE